MDREEAIKAFEEIKRNAETHLGKKYAIGCENYYKNKIELAEIALDALRLNENQTRSSDDILYADHTGDAADMMDPAITDLLARAEEAEAREKNLIEAVKMITERAEEAERAVAELMGISPQERITTFFGHPIDRVRELVKADREGRCVVLPDVDERERKSMADGLQDVFSEWAYEDPDVGLFGMSDGEKELANSLISALKGERDGKA